MAKKEKKAKAETKKNEAVKEKKVKKNQDKTSPTFLNSVIILASVTIIAALAGSGLMLLKSSELISTNNQIVKENTLKLYQNLVNSQIELMSQDISKLASLVQQRPELFIDTEIAKEAISTMADTILEDAISFKVFSPGDYPLDKDSYPPVNFATQKQLLTSESAQQDLPEFYNHAKGNYISIATAVRNPADNELTFILLVSYPETVLTSVLPSKSINNTKLVLNQTFDNGAPQTIFISGKSATKKPTESLKTIHPNWSIEYFSNQETLLKQDLMITVGISATVTIVLMFLAIFISVFLLKKNLGADLSLIFEFIRSGHKKSIKSHLFKTGLVKDLYRQLKEAKVQSSPAAPQTVPSQKVEDENFEIDIATGDDDLFGKEHIIENERNVNAPDEGAQESSKIHPGIFRAYDIRGIVDETLTAEAVSLIGQAIGSEAIAQGEQSVIIARDGRLSGPSLSEALKQGILSSGANVIDVGMVPTPVLYFACKTLESKTGVMLTGSHNPSNHNGLKIVINGVTLSTDGIQNLKQRVETNNLESGEGVASEEDVMPAYLEAIENDVILAQPMNIVVDCGNGVTGVVAENLFEQLGCNVTPLFTEVDGNFPNHHPDPSQPKNLEALINKVKETGAHLGLAFDGDGDRVGVVTNSGKIIWADRLMMLFARDVLLRSPGADIIFDVKCSNTLAETIRKNGGRPLMWKTGHSLIKAKLAESGAQLAGEMSGHIFFNDRWFGFDDGLYSAARLLEILSTDGKSADEIFAGFPEMVSTPEINIAVDDEGKFDMVTMLASVGDFGDGNKNNIDGIRVDYADGWGLVRASNTTANLVTRFEAKSEERLEEIKAVFKAQILKIQNDLDIPF